VELSVPVETNLSTDHEGMEKPHTEDSVYPSSDKILGDIGGFWRIRIGDKVIIGAGAEFVVETLHL